MAQAASPPDGLTHPGIVIGTPPNHYAQQAQTLKNNNGGTVAGAIAAALVLVAASSDATQARYLQDLQYLRNNGSQLA